MQMTLRDWMLLLLLSLIWGGSYFFTSFALQELPPLTIVVVRTGIASLVIALVLKFQGVPLPLARSAVPAFVILGLFNNLVPFSLLGWAQTVIPSSLASILVSSVPVFSIVIAHFMLPDEKLAARKVIGIAFGFMGVFVLLGGEIVGGKSVALLGIGACLLGALFYGLGGVLGRRYTKMGLSPTQMAFGQLLATTLMLAPVASLVDAPWTLPMPSSATVAAVLALSILSTGLAVVIFFYLLVSAGAVNVSMVAVLIPVSAILLGTTLLGEELMARHYIGLALISAALIVIDGRLFRCLKSLAQR